MEKLQNDWLAIGRNIGSSVLTFNPLILKSHRHVMAGARQESFFSTESTDPERSKAKIRGLNVKWSFAKRKIFVASERTGIWRESKTSRKLPEQNK